MKITINQKELLHIFEQINKAIDPLSVFLELRAFYIEVVDGKLIVIGSNSNISMKSEIEENAETKIEGSGKFLLPSNLFLNLIKKCSGVMTINVVNNVAYIENDQNRFEINIQNAIDFPPIDFNLYGTKLNINLKEFRNILKNVSFAADINNNEIIFNGINISLFNNKLLFSATDRHRLSTEFMEIKDERNLEFNVSIFAKNLKDIVFDNVNENIDIYINDYKIIFVYKNIIAQSKIIDAPYKDLSGIFPSNFNQELIVDKKEFLFAINKANFTNSDSTNKTRLEIKNNIIKISSFAEEIGKSEIVFKDFDYNGDDLIITLSHKFLKEAISVFDGKIKICFNGDEGNVVIVGESRPNNKQLIAPQRTY